MMEDWRFRESPYVELGGLVAYAGAPLRLQNESGDCVGLGSLCVASSSSKEPLTKPQQNTLARMADWVVSDIIQCTRARRQRERYRMSGLVSTVQKEAGDAISEDSVLEILRATYPEAEISLKTSNAANIEVEGRDPIPQSDLLDGVWEDIDYIDDFVTNSNHQELPSTRVVRVMAVRCESISGSSLLVVASKDFRLVFDDIDFGFVQTCANILSHAWQKRLLGEVMRTKEKFLRGVCHQLRTPIHGILGSVELLAEELKTRDSHDEGTNRTTSLQQIPPDARLGGASIYLDTIEQAGRDLNSIVNGIITLNRWADIAMSDRRYAIHAIHEFETELTNEVSKTTRGSTHHRADLVFTSNLPPDCNSLRTDLGLLRDSLLPLIVNAIQHTQEGIVVVTTSVRPDSKELIVDVEDAGRGIHPDHRQRIFEPYEKVDPQSRGAGLGLTLASKFAALLRGSIVLMPSASDRGSHFRATFQEVECAPSPPFSRPLVLKLKNIPPKFYNMAPISNNVSLCDYFARFLTSQGFTFSNSMEDSLLIFEFIPDMTQRRKYLAQISPEQIAICLVAASKRASLGQTPENVLYVTGPFSTSTMSSALEEADGILFKIKASRRCHELSPAASSLADISSADEGTSTDVGTRTDVGTSTVSVANTDSGTSTDSGIGTDSGTSTDSGMSADESMSTDDSPGTDYWVASVANSLLSNDRSAELPERRPIDPRSDASASRIYQSHKGPPAESSAVIPIFTPLTKAPLPTALLVDDNAVNLRILQMYCRKRGLPHHCATDGLQAVKLFSQFQSSSAAGEGAGIELIFMDLQMPTCDGIEATRQIRLLEKQNNWGESAIFIVTGQDSPSDRTDAEGAGADDYFVKPVSIKVFDRSLKRHFPAFAAS
jgi:signal transduction histidine kinase/CheY-like chemotaxis protein